jgi:hypothetical protein
VEEFLRLCAKLDTFSPRVLTFRTILPALYPGRTRHYHIKVQARHAIGRRALARPDGTSGSVSQFHRRTLFLNALRKVLDRIAIPQDGINPLVLEAIRELAEHREYIAKAG